MSYFCLSVSTCMSYLPVCQYLIDLSTHAYPFLCPIFLCLSASYVFFLTFFFISFLSSRDLFKILQERWYTLILLDFFFFPCHSIVSLFTRFRISHHFETRIRPVPRYTILVAFFYILFFFFFYHFSFYRLHLHFISKTGLFVAISSFFFCFVFCFFFSLPFVNFRKLIILNHQ